MSFDSGAVTARMFYLNEPLPANAVELFAQHAAPGLQALEVPGCHSFSGWVAGRHLLDRSITPETAVLGGYLKLTYMTAEKKVSESLLQNECKLEFLAAEKATGQALKLKARMEIQKDVKERLLRTAQPVLRGISLVYKPGSKIIFAEAMSDQQIDSLCAALKQTVNRIIVPCNANSMAAQRGVNVNDLDTVEFAGRECESTTVGMDFMTWLWFSTETITVMETTSQLVMMLDAPLTLVNDGQGAHECVLRKGTPTVSAEAKAALTVGKKLRDAVVIAARSNEAWKANFNAATWAVTALTLPTGSGITAVERFQERMASLETFHNMLVAMYTRFLDVRTSPSWPGTVEKISQWITERAAR